MLSIVFVLIYLVLNLPSALLFSQIGSTTWYPANGLFLAIMVAVSPWYGSLGAVCGSLAGALIYHQPLNSWSETLGSLGVSGCYAGAAYLLRGPLEIDLTLGHARDVARYIAVTTVAALGATTIGVACLAADHAIAWTAFWTTASSWFVGDEIAILGIAPFLLIHLFPWVESRLARKGLLSGPHAIPEQPPKFDGRKVLLLLPEAIGQVLTLLAVLGTMFWPPMGNIIFMSFVPILWMAVRQGVRRVSFGIVALNFGIVLAMRWFPPPPMVFNRIGLLMFVVSAAGLIAGSAVTDRHHTESDLRERTVYLDSLIENSPLGIVVLDRQGRVEMSNHAFTKLFLFEQPNELVGSTLHDLFPLDHSSEEAIPWSAQVISGQSLHRIVRRQRRDGQVFDLEMQAVPLVVDGGVRGAFAMCRDISEQMRASEAEREHAAALNRLVKELKMQADQMTQLDEMATLLQCCSTIDEARTVVCKSASNLFPDAVFGSLYTFRASRNLVEAAVSWGDSGVSQAVFSPDGCWALRRGQSHWSDTSRGSITCPHLAEMSASRYLCVPMMGQGETLGVLSLGFSGTEGEAIDFRQSRQQLGATVAGQVALSLASLQLREKLRDQSVRDPLTRLFNRRFMHESLEREIIRARRKNQALSLLFLDIDHFKRFNDTFGHDAGDLVLESMAEVLRRFFRGDDVACRCGGEEFAVILPESLSAPAAVRANALRSEIKKMSLRHRGVTLDPITLSIGVATFPDHCATPDELLRIADQCLYQSKTGGRDRVTIASEIPHLSKYQAAPGK